MSASLEIKPETAELLASQAKARGLSVSDYVKSLLDMAEQTPSLAAPAASSDVDFETAMEVFAEGTEHLPPYSGKYSREDIYFDHD